MYPYLVVVYKFCYKISNTFLTKLLLFGLINNQITIYIQILTICCTLICTHPWDVQEVLRSTWRCDIGNHKWSCEWLYVCEGTEWQYVSNFTNYKVQYMKMYMLMCYDVIVLVYRLWLQDCQPVWQLLKVWKCGCACQCMKIVKDLEYDLINFSLKWNIPPWAFKDALKHTI